MRQVEFQEVGMENYGPYIDPMVFNFVNDSLVLITGPNGIGKTMSLDAIPFTLYGVTSKGAKGDDVVNNKVGKNCKTWVKFKIDSRQYIVTRYHKYTKYGNTVILNVDGVDTKKGHKEVLPEIERSLCPRKTFMNTLMFGQKVKDFFTDLGDADKKEIFRMILNLAQYLSYYKTADENVKDNKVTLETLNTESGIQSGLLTNAKEEIETWEQQKVYFEKDKKKRLIEMKKDLHTNHLLFQRWEKELADTDKKETDLSSIIGQISFLETELSQISTLRENEQRELKTKKELKDYEVNTKAEEEKTKIKGEYRDSGDDLRKMEQDLKDELQEKINITQEKKHKLELSIEQLESENQMHAEQVLELMKVIKLDEKNCPLCKQEVNAETVTRLTEKCNAVEERVGFNTDAIDDMKRNIKLFNKFLSNDAEKINSERDEIKTKLQILKLDEDKKIKEVELRLFEAKKKILNVMDLAFTEIGVKFDDQELGLKNRIEFNKLEKERAEEAKKQSEKIIENMRNVDNRISEINAQIEWVEEEEYDKTQLDFYKKKEFELSSQLTDLKNQQGEILTLVEAQQFWKTGYSSSGIPSMLIDDSIPFMNERVAYYLDKLTNGRYVVSFDTLAATKAGEFRDKISVNVLDTFTRANSRVQLSGGQTRIIDIATILTLGDLQSNIQHIKINILIFDEIFDSLDEENISYVSKVLNKLKFGRSIYLISHRHEDQLEADEVLAMA